MRYVSEKSMSHTENGKQLQVTLIKITESKENKSIHRLDLVGSTAPGRAAPRTLGLYRYDVNILLTIQNWNVLKENFYMYSDSIVGHYVIQFFWI